MRRPVGGDSLLEKYLLAVDAALERDVGEDTTPLSRAVAGWTGGEWTWTWVILRDPPADLVASARPYFFPSGTRDAQFKELRVELSGRVWLPDRADVVSTAVFFTQRLGRTELESAKGEEVVRPLVDAIKSAAPELADRADTFPEAQHDRVNWIEWFNNELRIGRS